MNSPEKSSSMVSAPVADAVAVTAVGSVVDDVHRTWLPLQQLLLMIVGNSELT